MANRAELRTHLRRRLQELTPAQWSDATLNDYLNLGYQMMQEEIETLYPEAFLYIDTTDVVAAQRAYAPPLNMKSPRRFRLKMGAGEEYTDLSESDLDLLYPNDYEKQTNRSSHTPLWALEGQYFVIDPTPSASIADGIELTYVPTLMMGDDSDVPEMPANVHIGIIVGAQYHALSDTANAVDKEATTQEMNRIIARLPRHFKRTLARRGGEQISVPQRIKFGSDTAASRFGDFEIKE